MNKKRKPAQGLHIGSNLLYSSYLQRKCGNKWGTYFRCERRPRWNKYCLDLEKEEKVMINIGAITKSSTVKTKLSCAYKRGKFPMNYWWVRKVKRDMNTKKLMCTNFFSWLHIFWYNVKIFCFKEYTLILSFPVQFFNMSGTSLNIDLRFF